MGRGHTEDDGGMFRVCEDGNVADVRDAVDTTKLNVDPRRKDNISVGLTVADDKQNLLQANIRKILS